jgi:hypothetical protein
LKYQLRTDTNSNWVDFVNGSDVPAGYIVSRSSPNLIYIRALDKAGNPSAESSIEYYCDNTPPTDLSVTIEENENADYQYVTGSTIYYNTSVCGSFWVRVSASDPESGLLKVVFPSLAGFAAPNGGENSTFPASWKYVWTTSSTQNGSATIKVYNKAGLYSPITIQVLRDITAPSGGFIVYENAYTNNLQVQVYLDAGSDSGSGLSHGILQRAEASLSGGTIGSWSDWSDIAFNPPSLYLDNNVLSGRAYKYRYLVYDRVGNSTIYASENVIKIDTGLPVISAFSLMDSETGSSAYAKSRQVMVVMSENDAETWVRGWYLSEDNTTPSPSDFSPIKPSSFTLSEGDGLKTVYAWVIDRAGNISSPRSASITLDTTPPTGFIVINNGDNYTNNSTVILALTYDSDVIQVRYSNDNLTWTDWGAPEDTKIWTLSPGDGLKTVYYQVQDRAGNVSTFWDDIVLDTTPDAIADLTSPTHPDNQRWYADNSVSFRWSVPASTAPIVGYSFVLDSNENTIPPENVNLIDNFIFFSLPDGVWYFHVRAVDAAGNWGPASHFRVQIDVTSDGLPTVWSPTHPNPSEWYNNVWVQLCWQPPSSTAPIAWYYYAWDKSENTIPDARISSVVENITLKATSDGTWYFHIRAEDAAGNLSEICHFKVNIDTGPPVAPTPILPKNGAILAQNRPTLRWTHPEDLENYEVEIYGENGLVLSGTSSVTWFTPEEPLSDGRYAWRVRAIDRAGNVGDWSTTFTLTIDTTPPAPPVLKSPENGLTPMHVLGPTLTWERVSDLTPVTYELWVDDDEDFSTPVIKISCLLENSYTPEETLSGTFYWKVRAKDAAGNVGEWSEVWTFTNYSRPPVVTNVVVEWKLNPRRVATGNPVISWTFYDEDGDSQTGARIQVSLLPGSEYSSDLVWDYTVENLTENRVTYVGGTLSRAVIYFVRVRVRDSLGVWGPWSDCQYNFMLNHAPKVENFKINGQVDPVNVGRVVFSWDYTDEDYDEQACYQIQIGADPESFDVWDSREVVCGPMVRQVQLPREVLSTLAENTKYYVRMRVKDGRMEGNRVVESYSWSDWVYGSFTTNIRPRIRGVLVNGGAVYTRSADVTLTIDAVGGAPIQDLMWRMENTDWMIEGFSATKSLRLEGGEGLKEIWLRVRDAQGWESENDYKVSIIYDKTPPVGLYGTYPANNAVVGTSPVRLSWSVPSDQISGVVSIFTVEVSFDESFVNPSVYTTEKNYYDLNLGDQKMTVYWRVRARDRAGNENCTPVYKFIYDPTPPSLTPSPSLQLGAKTTIVNSLEVPISLGGSNVAFYRYAFSQEELAKAAWIPYTENTLILRLPAEGQYLVYFEAKSPAGSVAGPFVIGIFVDLTPPKVQLSADNLASRSKVRTLYIFASDSGGSGVSEMRLKLGENWTDWENYIGRKVIELEEGLNVVMVQVRDKAGNESPVAKIELYYSARPPEVGAAVVKDVSGREVEIGLDNLPSAVTEPVYVLKIPAQPGVFLFVNGERIEPTEGFWVVNLRLREGKNTFILSTVDLAGAMWEKTLELIYTPKATAKPAAGGLTYIPLFALIGAAGAGVFVVSKFRGRAVRLHVPKRLALRPQAVKPFVKKEEKEGRKEGG